MEKDGNGRTTRLEHPEFRKFVCETLADTEAAVLRADNTSEENLRKRIDKIAEHTDGDMRLMILRRIDHKLETQKELSFYIRNKLNDCSIEQLVRIGMLEAWGEAGLEHFSQDGKLRLATLDYLTSPSNQKSILGGTYTERQKQEKLRRNHENFWDLPFEGRQAAIEKVLFPVHENTQEAFDKNMQYAMDKIFPPKNGKNNPMGRVIIDSFLQVSDLAEKRLLLSAMLVGAEPAERGKYSEGKALSRLRILGPAGEKLVQAIHSHSSTPEHIRAEIGDSKSSKYEIPRYKIHEWLERFGPDTNPNNPKTVHVGPVLGVGAYGAAVALEKEDETKTACTLLKPSADQAESMFGKFSEATQIMIGQKPQLRPVVGMIEQAKANSAPEINMEHAAKQEEVAKQTNGFRVMIDGVPVEFETARWVGHGERYKETEIVEGEHFNDLPENTSTEREIKWRAATAMLAKKMYILMSGRPSDHDQHGAQQRISTVFDEGDSVNPSRIVTREFDHGGQAIKPPATADKQLMSTMIARTAKRSVGWFGTGIRKKGFAATFGKEINKAILKYPSQEMQISEFNRDVLALQDAYQVAERLKPGTARAVLSAVFNTGDIDPDIRKALRTELGALGLRKLKKPGRVKMSIKIIPPAKR